jgi:hypothetical protein
VLDGGQRKWVNQKSAAGSNPRRRQQIKRNIVKFI